MLRIKLAFRIFKRNLLNSLISLLGLALGFCCFILVTLYHTYEKGHDRFNQDSEYLYRVIENRVNDGNSRKVAAVGALVGSRSYDQIPEIDAYTNVMAIGRLTLGNDLALRDYERIWVMDTNFFEVFSYEMILGNSKTALTNSNSILLSESLARKHFDGELPELGDSIYNNFYNSEIGGVFADPPAQSHLQFDMIVPAEATSTVFTWWDNYVSTDWENNSFGTYFRLKESADPAVVADKITELVRPNYPEEIRESSFELQPVTSIHFGDKGLEGTLASNPGNSFYVSFLSILGVLVLVVAAFNFTNITTASALRRTREIGLRKTVGAGRFQVISQFLIESLTMVLIAALLAIFLADLLLPLFNDMMNTSISLHFTDTSTIVILLLVSLLVGIIASLYPAWIVSKIVPAEAVNNKLPGRAGGMSIRKALVIAQFAVAILMITSTLVIYRQLQYMQNVDLGFSKDNMAVIDINSGSLRGNFAAIKAEMMRVEGVNSVSVTSRVPGEWKVVPVVSGNVYSGDVTLDMPYIVADEDFLETFSIDLLAGKSFSGSDADSVTIMINQTAANEFGLSDPVGATISIKSVNWDGDIEVYEEPFNATVIGVVEDFYFSSFREEIRPMVMAFRKNPIENIDYFTVRMESQDVATRIDALKEVNNQFDPDNPMEYHFLDEQFDRFFVEDRQRARVFAFFSAVVIFISCMGLFALASFEIRYRMKEVGIRKVMGASVNQIVLLFARNFTVLIGISFMIAAPAGWWVTMKWLDEFAYKFSFSPWMLIIPGILILSLATLTVGYLTFRAAQSNPVNVIRNDN